MLFRTVQPDIPDRNTGFYLFRTLNEAREITERWLTEYNSERPHESLNNLTPEELRLMATTRKSQKVRGTKTDALTDLLTPCLISKLNANVRSDQYACKKIVRLIPGFNFGAEN